MAALAVAWVGPPASAASLALDVRDREAAVSLGQQSITQDAFGTEWRVVNGSGESVEVFTPFHRIALAARHAAFRNEPLKPQDQERMLQELKERLMVAVQLIGPRADFARHYRSVLLLGDGRQVQPAVAQHDHTAIRRDDGQYLARGTYWFPTRDLSGTSRVTLVISDPAGQSTTRFVIDLARMR